MADKPSYEELERRIRELEQAEAGRREAEARLLEKVDLVQGILDATDAHTAFVGEGGRILLVNEAWRRFARANNGGDECRWGVGASYVRPCSGEDGHASLAEEAYEGLRKVQQREVARFELQYPCHSPEEERWFQMHVLPVPGRPGQALVSHTNITRLKKAEDLLREQNAKLVALLENTDDVIASRDLEGRLTFFNSAFKRIVKDLFGIEARPGIRTTDYLPSKDRAYWLDVLDRVLKGETFREEFDWHFGEGGPRSYEICFNPIRIGDEILGTVEFTRDITERRQTERAQKRLSRELLLRAEVAHLFLTSRTDRVYSDVLDLLLRELESRHGYLGYIDESGDLVCPSMTREIWDRCRIGEKSIVFPRGAWGGLWGESLKRKEVILCNEILSPPKGHIPLRNALAVPLMVGEEVVGQIVVANKRNGYDREDKDMLVNCAAFIAPILRLHLERDHARRDLQEQAQKLEERNTALNVLLEHREDEKKRLADQILRNFERLVFPYYNQIEKTREKEELLTYLEIVENNTRECLSSLEKTVSTTYRAFTPTEIQVADLIKAGKSSKEIADLLAISPRSVYFHRNNIRRKLKIHQKKENLRSVLMALS